MRVEGLITEKILYEISKSWDFAKDFQISGKISRFQSRFQDFTKISRFHLRFPRFHLRFRDFQKDYARYPDFSDDFCKISMKTFARFTDSSADFDILILNFRMM